LIKLGARIARHLPYVIFQMAEIAVSRAFPGVLGQIDELRLKPAPA
jgi:hypothetical protein